MNAQATCLLQAMAPRGLKLRQPISYRTMRAHLRCHIQQGPFAWIATPRASASRCLCSCTALGEMTPLLKHNKSKATVRRVNASACCRFVTLILLPMFLAATSIADQLPDDPKEAEAQRDEVRKRIKAMSKRLTADRRDRDALASALHGAERRISDLSHELGTIEARLATKRTHLKSLKRNRDQRRASVGVQRQELKRHIRAAYMLGRQDRLKLLLNQEDPAAVSRIFTYYEYFNRTRSQRIQALRQEITALAQIETGIREQTSQLEGLKQRNALARASLESEYGRRREAMLAALEQHFPKSARWTRPTGGMFIWVELPDHMKTAELLWSCVEDIQVAFIPGAAFNVASGSAVSQNGHLAENCLRLNFSNSTPNQINQGIAQLGKLLRRVC